jgi:tetratricopeptide (TPR) repeat protein
LHRSAAPERLTIHKMILTQCAVCATELGLSLGKKCGRCSTRYCGPECQVQHWKDGGHDKLCKLIKKAGGAEQYNANQKYTEAVAVAAEACAEDTKGQTCYICTQALHWKTKEGLVRGCSCRGTAGFAHVSCLVEQAKILVAEAEENNKVSQWHRWHTCSLCEQEYNGVVACALGWACWKTNLGRAEGDGHRRLAIGVLGGGLSKASREEEALSVYGAELATLRRVGASENEIFITQNNLATTYQQLGRDEEAMRMLRDVYSGSMKLNGEEHPNALTAAANYAAMLGKLGRFKEARSLLHKTMAVARRVLGESHELTIKMRYNYAGALYNDAGGSLDVFREAVTTFEDLERTARRVLGGAHPLTLNIEYSLRKSRAALAIREGDDVSAARAMLDALKAA